MAGLVSSSTPSKLDPAVFRLLEAVQYNTHPIDGLAGRVDPASNVNLTEVTTQLTHLTPLFRGLVFFGSF